MTRETLGAFEYEVLATLLQQPNNSYGSTIRERIRERTKRDSSVGALYTTLDRLENKGFVTSWWGEATPERGGRRKRFYRIEAAGQNAVRLTENRQSVWIGTGATALVGT